MNQTVAVKTARNSMPQAHPTACPVCTAQANPLHGPTAFRLRCCQQCRAVFLDTAPVALPEYAQQIEQQYFGSEFAEKSDTWAALYEKWNNQRTLSRLPVPAPGATLLEIGIGSGSLLRAAAEAGWQVAGLEASPEVSEQVRRRQGVSVFTGLIEHYDQSFGAAFDVIVMNHVLEHMPDPVAGLQQVRRLLKADGVLHLAVPNFDSWEARFRGWISYQPYHLFYFGQDSLRYVLQKCGYSISSLHSYEPFSGWINTLIHTATDAAHTAEPPVELKVASAGSRARRAARNGFEVARLAAGGLLLPFRAMQSWLGRGEELVVLAGHSTATEKAAGF